MTSARAHDESGFTLVEVLVAATLLVVGLLGTFTMVDRAGQATRESSSREMATALSREVLEKSRVIGYADIDGPTISTALKARPELTSTSGGSWTVTRRGVSYTITVDVCALDDAIDGYGPRTAMTFCSGLPAAGTADSEPVDFKRVGVNVQYELRGRSTTVRQVATRTARGNVVSARVQSIVATTPTMADPAAPLVTNPAVGSVGFSIVAGSTAKSVTVVLDDLEVGQAVPVGNGKDWTFTLPVSARADGVYEVGARATDARGVTSPTVSIPLTLSRAAPDPPTGLEGGRNEVVDNGNRVSVAELSWLPSQARNVVGYRVYRPDNSLVCPTQGLTATDTTTWCIDFAPQTGVYGVAALYRGSNGALQETSRTPVTIAAPASKTFYLRNTQSSYSSSACGAAKQWRDLVENHAGTNPEGVEPQGKTNDQVRFCSPVQTAATMPAGTTHLHVWLSNSNAGTSCPVTFQYTVGGTQLASLTQNVPHSTTPIAYDFSGPVSSYTIGGKQLSVLYSTPTGSTCDGTRVHFGGTTRRSRIELPLQGFVAPAGPTGLSATAQSDGSVRLQWTASSDPAVTSYRIYRDGANYTDRYDRTGDAATGYVDPNRDGGTHVYRVTAVTDTLAESLPAGPVTG